MSFPIAFLPGASGHGSFWDPVRSLLPQFDSFAMFWPGLGTNAVDPAVGSYDDLVRITIERLEQAGTPHVVVGQSMGGYVAIRIALERPDLVGALVLCVTSAGIDRGALGLDQYLPAPDDRPESQLWVSEPQPTFDDRLRSLEVPTLLVWASDDSISPIAIGKRLDELLPQSELVVYQSDDHWVVLEHPHDVARRIAAHARRSREDVAG